MVTSVARSSRTVRLNVFSSSSSSASRPTRGAASEVDRLSGGEGRVALLLGDDLARLDADAGLEVELTHLLERGERGPDCALGVVLVGERDAEGGHDRVAGELLHRAAVRDDAA